jgi:hypothetical protein
MNFRAKSGREQKNDQIFKKKPETAAGIDRNTRLQFFLATHHNI